MIAIQGNLEKVAEIIAAYAPASRLPPSMDLKVSLFQAHRLVLKAAATCQSEHLPFAQLEVSHAFHSPLMSPMLGDFARIAEEVEYSAPP